MLTKYSHVTDRLRDEAAALAAEAERAADEDYAKMMLDRAMTPITPGLMDIQRICYQYQVDCRQIPEEVWWEIKGTPVVHSVFVDTTV